MSGQDKCSKCLGLGYISDWDSQGRHDRPCECEAGRAYATQAIKMLKRIADMTLELADARELLAARNLNTIYSSDIYTAMRERAEQAVEENNALRKWCNESSIRLAAQDAEIGQLRKENSILLQQVTEAEAVIAAEMPMPEELARLRAVEAALKDDELAERVVGLHDQPHDPAYCRACTDERMVADYRQAVREAAKGDPDGQ